MLLYHLYKSHIMFYWPSAMFYVSQKLIGASRMKISVQFLVVDKYQIFKSLV